MEVNIGQVTAGYDATRKLVKHIQRPEAPPLISLTLRTPIDSFRKVKRQQHRTNPLRSAPCRMMIHWVDADYYFAVYLHTICRLAVLQLPVRDAPRGRGRSGPGLLCETIK